MFEVRFTEPSARVTGTMESPETFVLDLGLQASSLTLVLRCLEIVQSAPFPVLYVRMETALDLRDGKWFSLGDFNPVGKPDDYDKRDFTGLLRYVRWNVIQLDNASAATFMIFGVAR
jgi:hypothetical protein